MESFAQEIAWLHVPVGPHRGEEVLPPPVGRLAGTELCGALFHVRAQEPERQTLPGEVQEDRARGRDGVLDLGLWDAMSRTMEVQDDRVALRRVVGELLDHQLPCARDALPVDVPPVVALPVLPETRELVPLTRRGAFRPRLPAPTPHRKARQLEDLRIDRDPRAGLELSDKAQEPERVGGPDLRRTQLVEPPPRKEYRLLGRPLSRSLDGQHLEQAPSGQVVHHSHARASRPGRVGDHEPYMGGAPGHEAAREDTAW